MTATLDAMEVAGRSLSGEKVGLSIVQRIVGQPGGVVEARNRSEGGGVVLGATSAKMYRALIRQARMLLQPAERT